jgi:dTDP-4-dehydrorhamnose 3,5-epimerase
VYTAQDFELAVNILETKISGCYVIENLLFRDARGVFCKTFHIDGLQDYGLQFPIHEQFVSFSKKNVLRGMHFQVPPHAHSKMVTCITGSALDVVVDIRVGSPTYGNYITIDLLPGMSVWIPKGIAHGFLSLEDNTGMLYNTSHVHVPDSDRGIRWDSFGYTWPYLYPIISERDYSHPPLSQFASPFLAESDML